MQSTFKMRKLINDWIDNNDLLVGKLLRSVIFCYLPMILVVLLTVQMVFAVDMCSDSEAIDGECRLVSPSLVCDVFSYNITDLDGVIVEEGNLTLLNGSLYYVDLSLPEGDYVISLCDGSTRELRMEVDNMIWVLYLIIFVTVALMTLAFIFSNHTLAWMSGILMLIIGVYIIINGVGGIINFLTHGFGAAILGLGFWLFIATSIELMKETYG